MSTTRPILITKDAELAEEAFRLAAVAGCEPGRASDPAEVSREWRSATVLLLDAAEASAIAATDLPRRHGVLVICRVPTPEIWQAAFAIGAERVLELPEEEAELVDLLAEAVDGSASRSGRVLAVLGGSGGAGASVLAAGTAVAAAQRGDRCLLLDGDPLGGGLDLAVGVEAAAGLRWSGLTVSGGRVAAGALHAALPERKIGSGSLSVLSCDRDGPSSGLTPQAVTAVITAGRRAGETLVCDLPRALSESAAAALRLTDLTVVVVPAEVRACAAAARMVASVREVSAGRVGLVVRGPAPSGLQAADVARAVGHDVLTTMRAQPGLPAAMDRGGVCTGKRGMRGSVARSARELLAMLDQAEVPGPVRVGAR